MALLNTTQQAYYQGNDFGNYQFISLKDIINQFMLIYVGEDKIIPRAKRLDVAFHAQRALAELSFDTLKSCKTQEIVLPPSLQMILPHDYVNYTRIMWSDSSGIKHPLYPTRDTQNPFLVKQDSDGNYTFPPSAPLLVDPDFSDKTILAPWYNSAPEAHIVEATGKVLYDTIGISNGELQFVQHTSNAWSKDRSRVYAAWQQVDVTDINSVELSAKGTTQAADTNITGGTLKIGIIDSPPDTNTNPYSQSQSYTTNEDLTYLKTLTGNDAEIEWTVGQSGVTQSLNDTEAIDVSAYNTVWVVIVSVIDFVTQSPASVGTTAPGTNSIDDISLTNVDTAFSLQTSGTGSSTTWDNYSSTPISENTSDNYIDDTYWPLSGSRYGIDPSRAQTNGSFFIDCRLGKIHFSSNISGKTVILDYISDSLGTEEEMQVHKFAEEAMYKWLTHAILSGKASTTEGQIARLKRERFAAIRTAKLRLSNLKLEELTQILRGKSKWIKH